MSDNRDQIVSARDLPLVVDLDGTLIRGDLFADALMRLVFSKPWRIPDLLAWFTRGRAHCKARLTEAAPGDPSALPYDERLVAWLHAQRAAGRKIVLATASNKDAAQAVADHLGVFDEVFASSETTNLKSHEKAKRLTEAFPEGFAYAGNESADLTVWRASARAVIVNASSNLARQVRRDHEVEHEIPRARGRFSAFMEAIRPQHWVKNLLVFLPMLVGGGFGSVQAFWMSCLAYAALSFTASAVYLVNDAADIDADRRHPRKRNRPFASGALSPLWGLAATAPLLAAGLWFAARADILVLTLVYVLLTTLYTFALKRVVLLDVFVLAALYTIRIVIGGVASGYFASAWLLAFSCFFFFSLALVKRAAETRDMGLRGGGLLSGRGYSSADTSILSVMGVGSGLIAALVLALYIQEDALIARFSQPMLLWVLPVAEMFWISRVWLKTDRGEMHDDPLVFATRDWVSWVLLAVVVAAFAGALLA